MPTLSVNRQGQALDTAFAVTPGTTIGTLLLSRRRRCSRHLRRSFGSLRRSGHSPSGPARFDRPSRPRFSRSSSSPASSSFSAPLRSACRSARRSASPPSPPGRSPRAVSQSTRLSACSQRRADARGQRTVRGAAVHAGCVRRTRALLAALLLRQSPASIHWSAR